VLFVISPQVYRPLMLLLGVWAIFRAKPTSGRYGPAIDTLWVIAGLIGLGWPLANGEAFLYRAASPTGGDVLAGVLAIVVILEATRRTTGWIPAGVGRDIHRLCVCRPVVRDHRPVGARASRV
jgi:TRAP-type uncharacterized transport system fused permease subunit